MIPELFPERMSLTAMAMVNGNYNGRLTPYTLRVMEDLKCRE